jgi:hypothetical protein
LVLGVSAWRTVVKGKQLYDKEKAPVSEKAALIIQSNDEPDNGAALHIVQREKGFPVVQFLLLVLMWVILSALLLIRGGDPSHSSIIGIDCGTLTYWLLVGACALFLLLFTVGIALYVRHLTREKEQCGYTFLTTDLRYGPKLLFGLPAFSVVVGMAASFVGIGGGLLQGPLLLELGMHPSVATATTSFLVLFTSSSAAIQFLISGEVDWWSSLWYYGLGLISALCGRFGVEALMRKVGKQYVLVWFLACVILANGIVLLVFNVMQVVHGNSGFQFGSPCHVASK